LILIGKFVISSAESLNLRLELALEDHLGYNRRLFHFVMYLQLVHEALNSYKFTWPFPMNLIGRFFKSSAKSMNLQLQLAFMVKLAIKGGSLFTFCDVPLAVHEALNSCTITWPLTLIDID
jgi:hypothetical protein